MTKAQDLMLELIKVSSFNNFDGEMVVRDLLDHEDLWDGVIIDRDPSQGTPDLIKLRDIGDYGYNVDTLYISSIPGKESDLFELAAHWGADELDWLDPQTAQMAAGSSSFNREKAILRVWFD